MVQAADAHDLPETIQLHNGDCLEVLRSLPDNSIHAVICDPPYGLSEHKPADIRAAVTAWLAGEEYKHRKAGFMGKSWDRFVPGPAVWTECFRVLKPGGHLAAFAGCRTQDLMSLAIRLAGFEMRDVLIDMIASDTRASDFLDSLNDVQREGFLRVADDLGFPARLYWTFGQGFPKGQDVGKMIDKAAGAVRPVVGRRDPKGSVCGAAPPDASGSHKYTGCLTSGEGITDDGRRWSGWNTLLKSAYEPIILARKPMVGTVVKNVLAHGTGAMNIDACRIGECVLRSTGNGHRGRDDGWGFEGGVIGGSPLGRWPANVLHDGSAEVHEAFAAFGESKPKPSRTGRRGGTNAAPMSRASGDMEFQKTEGHWPADAGGTAARFFAECPPDAAPLSFHYAPKAGVTDRNSGCSGLPLGDAPATARSSPAEGRQSALGAKRPNHHPTVKPTSVMAWLCRLLCPPGGVVLDPFMGSGSTGKAAVQSGFSFIGCEIDPEYFAIAESRIAHAKESGDNATSAALQKTARPQGKAKKPRGSDNDDQPQLDLPIVA